MTRIENNRRSWDQLYEKYRVSGTFDPEIQVFMDEKGSADDMMELCYLFPLLNQLYKDERIDGGEKKVRVGIRYNALDDGSDNPNIWRVQPYLAQMSELPYLELSYYSGDKKLADIKEDSDRKRAMSRLFPICSASETFQRETNTPLYKDLWRCVYWERGAYSQQDIPGGLLPMVKYMDGLLQYIESFDSYSGTSGAAIPELQKRALRDEMRRELAHWRPEMTLLAQSIWLFLLCNLIEEKQLYSMPAAKGEDDVPHINPVVLMKSRMDAISFSEAMYQLIENACIHSANRQAWFGCRIHRAGRDVPMSRLEDEVSTRRRLYRKYRNCFMAYDEKRDVRRQKSANIFNGSARFFFEFFVLNGAKDEIGMVDCFNQDHPERLKEFGAPLRSIDELIYLPPREKPLRAHIEDLTVHYGLRLLRKIVSVNHGYLTSWTPSVDSGTRGALYYLDGNPDALKYDQKHKGELLPVRFYTEWNAIIPVEFQQAASHLDARISGGSRNIFGEQIPKNRTFVRSLDCDNLLSGLDETRKKKELVGGLSEQIDSLLGWRDKKELSNSIFAFHFRSPQLLHLELMAKALFASISKANWTDRPGEPRPGLRIALLLPTVEVLHEFLRLFSVFYIRGPQGDMEDVQVAFCLSSEQAGRHVSFLLAGDTLKSAYETARIFTYHNVPTNIEFLPLLDYLTEPDGKDQGGDCVIPPIFPFDLFLPSAPPEFQGAAVATQDIRPWEDSWFLEHMRSRLERDIRESGPGGGGCKISGVHIRLGSKLHIESFYEGELLFHNSGNVMRFAYLLTQELLYGDKPLSADQNIVLLGYEKYSTHLMQQIEYWLKQADTPFNVVQTAIIYDGEEAGDVIIKPCYSPDDEACTRSGLQVVSILPVGTTLSTVYKMHNIAAERLPIFLSAPHYTFRYDFSLILVNRDLFSRQHATDVTLRYWKNIDQEKKTVTTQPEESGGGGLSVKYLLPADAEWMAPDSCNICRNTSLDSHAVIGAKHSDTMPEAIFTLWDQRAGRFADLFGRTGSAKKEMEDNRNRLSALYGTIRYSHLYSHYNHFQFYLDFTTLYLNHRREIDREIQKKWNVDPEAFHLVVSPLQFTNSPFVKAVVDLVFHGNVRFLRINLSDIYREEARTKFSYIVSEFKALQTSFPSAKFCVHFADTSIVTGSVLNRARLLVRMLMEQTGCPAENVELFSKVFLLVNRCSYDTLHTFVKDPRTDVFAYIHLGIPSYNTENNFCPACRLENRYHLLEKRSTTEQLSQEFFRLGEKHKKRTSEGYDSWLEQKILNSHSYFDWLKQWLFLNVPGSAKELKQLRFEKQLGIDKQGPWKNFPVQLSEEHYAAAIRVKVVVAEYLEKNFPLSGVGRRQPPGRSGQDFLKDLSGICLRDVVRFAGEQTEPYDGFKQDALTLIQAYLIDVRAYMRLYTMQAAYETLEAPGLDEEEEYPAWPPRAEERSRRSSQATYGAMLKLISESLADMGSEGDTGSSGRQRLRYVTLAWNVEWLISYIKVLSREQIVNYYHCRQAITGIMSDMLQLLGLKSCDGAAFSASFQKTADRLERENRNWTRIIRVFRDLMKSPGGEEQRMCAQLEYQLMMILLHRTADLQNTLLLNSDNVAALIHRYYLLTEKYFSGSGQAPEQDRISYFELPPKEHMLLRYLKSLKLAAMAADDDAPCLALAEVSADLATTGARMQDADERQTLLLCARYIYIENTRMLYTGMQDLSKQLQKDSRFAGLLDSIELERPVDVLGGGIQELNQAIDTCLRRCYTDLGNGPQEKNILYQNLLGNFCRFWHKSTRMSPLCNEAGEWSVKQITFLLQYFSRLNSLAAKYPGRWSMDDLPYLYEELCRVICGFTGFQMCYMVYRNDSFSQIFAQSGYYVDFMRQNKILRNIDADRILGRTDHAVFPDSEPQDGARDLELIPGVYQLQKQAEEKDGDYLVVRIPMRQEYHGKGAFYLILQADRDLKIFDSKSNAQPFDAALQKARNILFMHYRLQEVFSRDRTVLLSFRFDCSYIRPIRTGAEHTYVLHISDLHVREDLSKKPLGGGTSKAEALAGSIAKKLEEWDGARVDLLAVTGDVVDGRLATAPQMEANYRNAEKLLTEIVIRLWEDEQGYLPHDWRRRVMIITGNHDYAAMNQFRAVLKRRALASGMPVDGESGTMSKFAYYIDFLIRYLDPPIDELIRDDLNEIRDYRNLGIKVLMLNCSGAAVPRRTNKMGVNTQKVLRLLNRKVWKGGGSGPERARKNFRMCLAHYSPQYELSYFLDDYDTLPGWEWESNKEKAGLVNKLFYQLCESLEAAFTECCEKPEEEVKKRNHETHEAHKKFQEAFLGLNAAMELLESGEELAGSEEESKLEFYRHLRKRISKKTTGKMTGEECREARELVCEMRENELFRQIERYNAWLGVWLGSGSLSNFEQVSQLFFEVKECLAMSAFDKQAFADILEEVGGLDLYLAGHIHAYAKEEPPESGGCKTLVADKLFYDDSDKPRGYIIELPCKDGQIDYRCLS